MHQQFKESYDVVQSVVSYHGTEQAETIVHTGFRGSASRCAKFGRGVYSSKDVYHALAYSKLTAEDKMTFLVVDLHLGPVALGRDDQVYFLLIYHSFPQLSLSPLLSHFVSPLPLSSLVSRFSGGLRPKHARAAGSHAHKRVGRHLLLLEW